MEVGWYVDQKDLFGPGDVGAGKRPGQASREISGNVLFTKECQSVPIAAPNWREFAKMRDRVCRKK